MNFYTPPKPMSVFYKDTGGKLCKFATDTYPNEFGVESLRELLDEQLNEFKPVLILIQGGKQG